MPNLKTIARTSRPVPHQNTKKTDPFYYSGPWRGLRKLKLNEQPYCEIFLLDDKVYKAEMVDHWKPRRLFPELELDYENLVSMSHHYHNKKRAIEKNINTKQEWHKVFDNHKVFRRCLQKEK